MPASLLDLDCDQCPARSALLSRLATLAGHPQFCPSRSCRRSRRCQYTYVDSGDPICLDLLVDGEPERYRQVAAVLLRLCREYRPGQLAAWIERQMEAGEEPALPALAVAGVLGALPPGDPARAEFRDAARRWPVVGHPAILWNWSRSGTESGNETGQVVQCHNSSSI